jgi:hypothetical protein
MCQWTIAINDQSIVLQCCYDVYVDIKLSKISLKHIILGLCERFFLYRLFIYCAIIKLNEL